MHSHVTVKSRETFMNVFVQSSKLGLAFYQDCNWSDDVRTLFDPQI